jgi:hypothetical protein
MTTRRMSEAYSTMIYQKALTAFDGTEPAGDAPLVDSIYRYAPAAAGGLIYWQSNEPIITNQLLVTLAVSGNIDLYLVNFDHNYAIITGEEFHLASKTGVTYYAEPDYEIALLPWQGLKLVTTTAGQVLVAASHERTFYH